MEAAESGESENEAIVSEDTDNDGEEDSTKPTADIIPSIPQIAISPDGQWLATSDDQRHTHVFNLDAISVCSFEIPPFSFSDESNLHGFCSSTMASYQLSHFPSNFLLFRQQILTFFSLPSPTIRSKYTTWRPANSQRGVKTSHPHRLQFHPLQNVSRGCMTLYLGFVSLLPQRRLFPQPQTRWILGKKPHKAIRIHHDMRCCGALHGCSSFRFRCPLHITASKRIKNVVVEKNLNKSSSI